MSAAPTPLLFSPPLPPVRLRTDVPLVIGRHSSCDLSVRCSDVSRRHSEVFHRDGRFYVRDAGSTNGTFVNGERVSGERALEPGDRIEVGSTPVTFCQIEVPVDSLACGAGDATVVADRSTTGDTLQGTLEQIPAFALLQVLEMGGQSGVLRVESPLAPGRIWFVEGVPVHAETEKSKGIDAALAIAAARTGRFSFEPDAVPPETTLRATVTQILLEAARLEDEAARLQGEASRQPG